MGVNILKYFHMQKKKDNKFQFAKPAVSNLSSPRFAAAIYSDGTPPTAPFLRHIIQESHTNSWHDSPFSREVFHFNENVYHHI